MLSAAEFSTLAIRLLFSNGISKILTSMSAASKTKVALQLRSQEAGKETWTNESFISVCSMLLPSKYNTEVAEALEARNSKRNSIL